MLSIQEVKKTYEKTDALKGVSLQIERGICFGLVGPNGAGKSTLIKMIASVIPDFDGEISFNFDDPQSIKRHIGYIPQDICLEQTLTALDNLYFFGKLYGLKGKELKERAETVLKLIGLEKHGKEKVLKFSGGMKRRLNIGCALLHEPQLIIMDEPTVGIDPQSRLYIFDMIEALKEEGCTIIYASHYMEEIERLCDEVAMIDQGVIVEQGEIDELLKKHAEPALFISGDNCLPDDIGEYCTVEDRKEGYLLKANNLLLIIEKILNYVKENASQLYRFELVQPRLEDVFISLTGSQLRD